MSPASSSRSTSLVRPPRLIVRLKASSAIRMRRAGARLIAQRTSYHASGGSSAAASASSAWATTDVCAFKSARQASRWVSGTAEVTLERVTEKKFAWKLLLLSYSRSSFQRNYIGRRKPVSEFKGRVVVITGGGGGIGKAAAARFLDEGASV